MTSENVIELADGAYKIKPNQYKNVSNDQDFIEDTQDDSLGSSLSLLVIQSETFIISKSQETPECPQTLKRPLKPVVDDVPKNSLSYQNTFFKEIG